MLECGKIYQVKEYDNTCLWLDIVTHSVSNGIVGQLLTGQACELANGF